MPTSLSQCTITMIITMWFVTLVSSQPVDDAINTRKNTYKRNFTMPGASPTVHDAYICTVVALDQNVEEWIVGYDPMASANRAHHLLLYGCSDVPQTSGFWDCGHHGVCTNGRIMYGWAKNAPATTLPPDVGFRIGGKSKTKYLTLQVHYAKPLNGIEDHSGLTLELTQQPQKYVAGILLMVDGSVVIKPHLEKVHADMECLAATANVKSDINIFGFRTHAHALGRVISGYKYDTKENKYEMIAKGNPQWPQAFYPTDHIVKVKPSDIVAARCTYNSTLRNRTTFIGSTGDDEMCNLYLMYYTDREKGNEWAVCSGVQNPKIIENLPEGNDVQLPSNPLLEEKAKGENTNLHNGVTYKPPSSADKAFVDSMEHSRKDTYRRNLTMPGVTTSVHDAYICTAFALEEGVEEWIVRYDPMASANRAHHMLLYGCSDVPQTSGFWDCGHHGVCSNSRIMYAWAKNAPATALPPDVGFRIGGKSKTKYLTLQIHYANPLNGIEDHSGLTLELTRLRQKYVAGILLMVDGSVVIKPHQEKVHADMECLAATANVKSDINIFGFRTHAHALGRVISGYKYDPKENKYEMIAKGNPQWPQAFYPTDHIVKVKPSDIVAARCTYNSTLRNRTTFIGSTGDDEMCNLYLMYYTDREKGNEWAVCSGVQNPKIIENLPEGNDVQLPSNPLLEEKAKGENTNLHQKVTYRPPSAYDDQATDVETTYLKNITMPGVTPNKKDQYLCTAMSLDENVEEWILKFNPMASANRAHHMLLLGCTDVPQRFGYWDCTDHNVCSNWHVIYAWAKNAPSTVLPPNVGFRIGAKSKVKFLTLQIHYASPLPGIVDHSGLSMEITRKPQQYLGGILFMADWSTVIKAHQPKVHADASCRGSAANVQSDINVFAFRAHAHTLGRVISGYKYDQESGRYTLIAKGNPQWPQAFYPTLNVIKIKPSDIVTARCTYNSTLRNRDTVLGSTSSDEMCNLYLMYYTDREKGSSFGQCTGNAFPRISANLPEGNDVPLPLLEENAQGENHNLNKEMTYGTPALNHPITADKKAHHYNAMPAQDDKFQLHPKPVGEDDSQNIMSQPVSSNRTNKMIKISDYKLSTTWGKNLEVQELGQVTAVATDSNNDVYIFHRGDRSWDGSTFDNSNKLVDTSSPIKKATILKLRGTSGEVLNKFGANMFYMPHGLTIDNNDKIWVTDVALHQVFQFAPNFGDGKPTLTLGVKFEPGSDDNHFCQPTAVAVMKTGEFYVSDGYCNARITKYKKDGVKITQFGKMPSSMFTVSTPPVGTFTIPHSITLAEDKGEVCVADREGGRVQCYDTSDAPHHTRTYTLPMAGGRLYAVAYSPAAGGRVYCVNGPQFFGGHKIEAFEFDFVTGQLLRTFSPRNQGFTNPHDLSVSDDGAELYVVEIGPNKVWKFISDSLLKARPTVEESREEASLHASQIMGGIGSGVNKLLTGSHSGPGSNWSTLGISVVLLGLLAVPIVVLTSVTLIVRARKKGRSRGISQNGSSNGFFQKGSSNGWRSDNHGGIHNLGSSLLHKHKGFRKLATEDCDDPSSGDSDVEEFSQMATRT